MIRKLGLFDACMWLAVVSLIACCWSLNKKQENLISLVEAHECLLQEKCNE